MYVSCFGLVDFFFFCFLSLSQYEIICYVCGVYIYTYIHVFASCKKNQERTKNRNNEKALSVCEKNLYICLDFAVEKLAARPP